MASDEKSIQNAVCEYLTLKKHFFWRCNTVGIFDPKTRGYRVMPKYSMAGVADVIVITEGGFAVFLEIKDKSKQSDAQKEFERRCKEVGCEYYIIHNLDELINIGL